MTSGTLSGAMRIRTGSVLGGHSPALRKEAIVAIVAA